MKQIVCVDKEWGIGKNGQLLCHLSGDLKYFKEKTLGNLCLMGQTTLLSLPGSKPLPGRETWVLTDDLYFAADCPKVHTAEALVLAARAREAKGDVTAFVCGGAATYHALLPYCDECLVTRMDRAFGADRFYDNLDKDPDWQLAEESAPQTETLQDGTAVTYRFCTYRRRGGK